MYKKILIVNSCCLLVILLSSICFGQSRLNGKRIKISHEPLIIGNDSFEVVKGSLLLSKRDYYKNDSLEKLVMNKHKLDSHQLSMYFSKKIYSKKDFITQLIIRHRTTNIFLLYNDQSGEYSLFKICWFEGIGDCIYYKEFNKLIKSKFSKIKHRKLARKIELIAFLNQRICPRFPSEW